LLGSAAGYLSFEILGDPLEHQTHLGMVNWNVFGLPLAGLAQGDRHELAALQRVLQDAGGSYQRTRTWCPTGTAQRKRKAGIVTVVDPQTEVKRG
jgi:hypothetical protein